MRIFSYKNRPVHLGPYPLETLPRSSESPDLSNIPPMQSLSYHRPDEPESLVNAMGPYAAILDLLRDGPVKSNQSEIPTDETKRSEHVKSYAYYHDASQVGICALDSTMFLENPVSNADVGPLTEMLATMQTKSLAVGVDLVMAELKETMTAPRESVNHHQYAIVMLYEYPRDPESDESGAQWIHRAQAQRASVRGAEVGVMLANYLRLLGYEARCQTRSCADVDLNKLTVAAGLGKVAFKAEKATLQNPYLGSRFEIVAVTTTLNMQPDRPLKSTSSMGQNFKSHGPAWWMGYGFEKNRFNATPYQNRKYKDGAYPFEKLKRVDQPTTFIDELRVPRVPKRTDMFARAIFGDMGEKVQAGARNGNFMRKSPVAFGARLPLGALMLLQDGDVAPDINQTTLDAQTNADNIHAALYFLGADAVGISRCPDWVYYSHDATGEAITPYHENAISLVIDQGHETMEGASGDDWIACSQSMRAYMRFSLLGGIVAEQIRRLGYSARTHTVMDGEVLQPPLLLLAGLGEVSRIGEVILNPLLGPRLKSGVITTNMPLAHSKPIDFGLQNFCNNCNKCARECPSGAITAGPKKMFNGYEIWKSDSQKCTAYRITQKQGAMCGRCMKTCPWNLEGLFAEAPFRWLASNFPSSAKFLAKLDDKLGNGSINPIKKWWWDLEMVDEGPYKLSKHGSNQRNLQTELDLKFEDQTLAVYPANLAPPPYPFPFPMDREAGIRAHEELLSPDEYKKRLAAGNTKSIAHSYPKVEATNSPVLPVIVSNIESETNGITKYEFSAVEGSTLPEFEAGAHIDVVVAPEYFRQYSLTGDPQDRSKYQIGVLREDQGRGGSSLLHRVFDVGRKVFISRPINHFPLEKNTRKAFLMAGGIGVTPLIAMAHSLHRDGKEFELHYSCQSEENAAFLRELQQAPWSDRVHYHFSRQSGRADLANILAHYQADWHVYTCGPGDYMRAVMEATERQQWPSDAIHQEYFSAPETPEYQNYPFKLNLVKSNRQVEVAANESATEALSRAGIAVDVKCSDGICGVCKCGLIEGDIEHRDFVLSQKQRATSIILCQSRAAQKDGIVKIDL